MKKIQYIISLFCVLAFLPACSDDDNVGVVIPTPSEINAPTSSEWVLTQPKGDENPYLFRLNWTKTKFFDESGTPVFVDNVVYEVEADLFSNDFSNPTIIATTSKLYTDIYTLELNDLVQKYVGQENKDPQTMSFRVKISAPGIDAAYSETSIIVVTPFVIQKPLPYIYVIGDMNGWDNGNTDYIMFREGNDPEDGVYTYTGYFKGTYLKFCAEEYLGSYDNMYCAGANGKLEVGDLGSFYAEEGFYTFTIDVKNMTWKLEPYDGSKAKTYTMMGPIGGFCGWDNEPLMTASAFDPHQWSITYTFTESTACKFRGDRDWTNNWGGQASDIPYGHAVFDGAGATIDEAGSYRIYFNDLTGHYVIKNLN